MIERDFNEVRKEYYRENSCIPREYWDYKWTNYKFDANFSKARIVNDAVVQSRKAAWKKSINYAENIKNNLENGKSILFVGKGSSGKTVLATLILREAIEKLIVSALYVPFSRLVIDFHTMYKREEISDSSEIYITPQFLCIDEVDSDRNMGDRFKNIFDNILMTRRYEKKPTIITSKVGISEIGKMCGDTIKRLIDESGIYEIINIYSEDDETIKIFDSNVDFDAEILIKNIRSISSRFPNGAISGTVLRDVIEKSVKRIR